LVETISMQQLLENNVRVDWLHIDVGGGHLGTFSIVFIHCLVWIFIVVSFCFFQINNVFVE
jgi:hypothetical protein